MERGKGSKYRGITEMGKGKRNSPQDIFCLTVDKMGESENDVWEGEGLIKL